MLPDNLRSKIADEAWLYLRALAGGAGGILLFGLFVAIYFFLEGR